MRIYRRRYDTFELNWPNNQPKCRIFNQDYKHPMLLLPELPGHNLQLQNGLGEEVRFQVSFRVQDLRFRQALLCLFLSKMSICYDSEKRLCQIFFFHPYDLSVSESSRSYLHLTLASYST